MRNEDILKEVDRRFNDVKEIISAKLTGISAKMDSNFDMASLERKEIIKHQGRTNDRVFKLEAKNEKIEKDARLIRCFRKRWYVYLLIAVFFIMVVIFLYDYGMIGNVLSSLFDKLF